MATGTLERSAKGTQKRQHVPLDPSDKYCLGKRSGMIGDGDPDNKAYCHRTPGHGTDHTGIGRCSRHGGASPGYAKKVHELEAKRSVELYGLPIEIDPHTALLQELHATAGHVGWLRQQVGQLKHDGIRSHQSQMIGPVGGGPEAHPGYEANVWIKMYNEERDRMVRVASACIKAGIEERKVRLAEMQGQAMAVVLKNTLSRLGIMDDPETAQLAAKIVREELTAAQQGNMVLEAAA